jgi:hypothetical protein
VPQYASVHPDPCIKEMDHALFLGFVFFGIEHPICSWIVGCIHNLSVALQYLVIAAADAPGRRLEVWA